MQPKIAIKILFTLVITSIIIFVFLYFSKNQNINKINKINEINETEIDKENQEDILEDVIKKVNKKEILNSNEEKVIIKTVDKKVKDRIEEIENKSSEEIKEKGYTQDELDFLANPKTTIEKEIGVAKEENANKGVDDYIDIQGELPERPLE